ncbi:hypothetical protein [Hydrogenimonas urashimensis]|uniref:hypothetical protein n=1 Tax=Hydrogenimonas urashimensis TaxID=2740515 RepID=UPI001915815E|nr:hypothetical protein [Hydrogenimonas urashimensis]
MIIKSLETLSANPNVVWGTFALGFLLPWCFLPFLILAAMAAFRELGGEYGEVTAFWRQRVEETARSIEAKAAPSCRAGVAA